MSSDVIEQNEQDSGEKNSLFENVYDRTYHTVVTEMPELLIPFMNDVFGINYGENAKVTVLSPKLPERPEDKKTKVRKTDSLFRIEDTDNPRLNSDYLMECETKKDNSIAIRFFRYGSLRAVHDYSIDDEGRYHFRFPRLVLLYLRPQASASKKDYFYVGAYGVAEELPIPIEVRSLKGYTLKKLIDNDLFFLIPFWPFKFISMASWENDPKHLGLYKAFSPIFRWLKDAVDKKKLSEIVAWLLWELMNNVFRTYAQKYPGIVEEVEKMQSMEEIIPSLKIKHQLEEKDKEIRDKDKEISDKDKEISDKDKEISEKDSIIASLTAQLEALKNTNR